MILGYITWKLTCAIPMRGSTIIAETVDGKYIIDEIDERWEGWSEQIVRWAYLKNG